MISKIKDQIPPIEGLRKKSMSLAMLDAIMEPKWQFRYYSFDSKWYNGKALGSMRDGEGDSYFILFNKYGAILKGYAHESLMAAAVVENGVVWPGVLESVPPEFEDFLREPAFSIGDTTFCTWRRNADPKWLIGKIDFPPGDDPDGSIELLSLLIGNAVAYQQWAEQYYNRRIDLDVVQAIYKHQILNRSMIARLNQEVTTAQIQNETAKISYPSEL